MLERQRVIVLKTVKYRESDLIVSALSSVGRRTTFIARAALKSRRRFGGGVLEPTRYIEVLVKSGGHEKKWPELQEAQMLKEFSGLRESYDRLQASFELMEWVLKMIPDGGGEFQDVFHLLGRALEKMEQSDSPKNLQRLVQLKLLALQGVLSNNHSWSDMLKMPLAEHQSFQPSQSESKKLDEFLLAIYRDYVGAHAST